MLATPIEVRHILGGELLLDRLPDGAHLERLPGRAHPVPASRLVPGAAGRSPPACCWAWPSRRRSSASPPPSSNDSGFAAMFRFVINPLFLFSGTFFPLSSAARLAEVVRVDRGRHAAVPRRGAGPRRGPGRRRARWPAGRWHVAYLVDLRRGLRGRRPSAPEPQAGEVDGRTDGGHRAAPAGTDADTAVRLLPAARPAAGAAQPARLPARLDHHRVAASSSRSSTCWASASGSAA